MVPSATPARSAISETREWKKPCSAMTSMAASRMRWYLSGLAPAGLVVVDSERFTVKAIEFTWISSGAQPKSSASQPPRVPVQKLPESLPTMAELSLLVQRKLGKSLAQRGEEEERIVPESSCPARGCQQLTRSLPHKTG